MRYEAKLSLPGKLVVQIEEIAQKEGIDNKVAIIWVLQYGVDHYAGIAGVKGAQSLLPSTRLSGQNRKKE